MSWSQSPLWGKYPYLTLRDREKCLESWMLVRKGDSDDFSNPDYLLENDPEISLLDEIVSDFLERKKKRVFGFLKNSLQLVILLAISMSAIIILKNAGLMENYIRETEEIIGKLADIADMRSNEKQLIQRLNEVDELHASIEAYNGTQLFATILVALLLALWFIYDQFRKQKEVTHSFSSIYANAQNLILLVDRLSGKIVEANPAALKALGYTKENLTGKYFRTLLEAPHEGAAFSEEGGGGGKQTRIRRSDERLIEVEYEVSSIVFNMRKTTMIIMNDVTEEKALSLELGKKVVEQERTMHRLMETKDELYATNETLNLALKKAVDISLTLLKSSPDVPTFYFSDIFHLSQDREGGDSLVFPHFRERYVGMFLQDVCGHDINAILDNIFANLLVETYKIDAAKKSARVPEMVCYFLNREMYEYYSKIAREGKDNEGKFTTAVYALFDYQSGVVVMSLAGHEPVILIRPDGSHSLVRSGGLPLGLYPAGEERDDYQGEQIVLASGEKLFFYTDGLMDEENDQGVHFRSIFLEELIPQMAKENASTCQRIVRERFVAFLEGKVPVDDITFVVAERKPLENYRSVSFYPSPDLMEMATSKLVEVNKAMTLEELEAHRKYRELNLDPEHLEGAIMVESFEEAYAPLMEDVERLGFAEKKAMQIQYCLEEALANALEHGNLASNKHRVLLSWVFHAEVLEVSVEDQGEGLKEWDIHQGGMSDSVILAPFGRGRHIIEQYADHVYNNNRGNVLYMIFRLV